MSISLLHHMSTPYNQTTLCENTICYVIVYSIIELLIPPAFGGLIFLVMTKLENTIKVVKNQVGKYVSITNKMTG